MQRKLVNGKCVPVYPHEYVRTNTIFEIIKAAGRRTAWSDKHPAYEDLSGPSGKGLDELYRAGDQLAGYARCRRAARRRLHHELHRRSHLRHAQGQGGAELDRRLRTARARPAAAGAGDLRHELPVGQRWSEARQVRQRRRRQEADRRLSRRQRDPGQCAHAAVSVRGQCARQVPAGTGGPGPRRLDADHRQRQARPVADRRHGLASRFPTRRMPARRASARTASRSATTRRWSGYRRNLQQATNPATGHPYYADAKAYLLANAASCRSPRCSIARR